MADPFKDPATRAAALLTDARRTRTRLSNLGADAPSDVASAHRIANIHAEQLDRRVAGWKVGATSDQAMQMLSSPGPFAGRVFEHTVHQSRIVDERDLVDPKVECEFAFIIGTDLAPQSEQYSVDEVKEATAMVAPALELVDSRFEDMLSVGYLNLIADSGANGGVVIGEPVDTSACPELASVGVRCLVDGSQTASGDGSAILGDPWRALEWLVNHLSARQITLSAGQFVMSGTVTGITPLGLGQTIVGDYGGFGQVEVTRNRAS